MNDPAGKPSRAELMQALYDRVPEVTNCQGHCWISCGPASMTPWERRRLALAGHPITPEDEARKWITDFWCDALGPDGLCRAYTIRPLICRMWAAVSWMPCPYGCKPEGGWIDDAESLRLLTESVRLGGGGEPVTEEMLARLDDPQWVAATVAEFAAQGHSDANRARCYGTKLPPAITRRPRLWCVHRTRPDRPESMVTSNSNDSPAVSDASSSTPSVDTTRCAPDS